MPNKLLNQAFSFLIVIFGVLLLTFSLIHLVPGDPVEVMLGESVAATDRDALRADLGLNKPLTKQISNYLAKL